MLRYVLTASIISFGALAAPTAKAAPARTTPEAEPDELGILQLLRSIDVVPPDRQALERAYPNARAELTAIARDVSQSDWTRLRAISFLSFYPEASTRSTLGELAVAPRVDVRRAAIYALGRTFGVIDPSVVHAVADAAEHDPDASVREHAVRALRWVDGREAGEALTRIAKARPELTRIVQTTVERRAARTR